MIKKSKLDLFFSAFIAFHVFFFFSEYERPSFTNSVVNSVSLCAFSLPLLLYVSFFFLYCCYPGNRFAENYVYCLLNKERKVPKSSSTIILFLFSLYMYFLLLFFFFVVVASFAMMRGSHCHRYHIFLILPLYINIYKYIYISTYIYIYIHTYIFL